MCIGTSYCARGQLMLYVFISDELGPEMASAIMGMHTWLLRCTNYTDVGGKGSSSKLTTHYLPFTLGWTLLQIFQATTGACSVSPGFWQALKHGPVPIAKHMTSSRVHAMLRNSLVIKKMETQSLNVKNEKNKKMWGRLFRSENVSCTKAYKYGMWHVRDDMLLRMSNINFFLFHQHTPFSWETAA